jgi:hypothetical protein
MLQEGKGEAGEVCRGLVKTHHPGGRLGGAKLGPASGVVGSAMLVTFPDVLTVAVRCFADESAKAVESRGVSEV